MLQFDKDGLIEYLQTTRSYVETNFPKLKAAQLAKGINLTKVGKGATAIYYVEQTTPQIVDKKAFSTRIDREIAEDLPGEIWVETYISNKHEVSNLGRIRRKKDHCLIKGHQREDGYVDYQIKGDSIIKGHRLVKQSFDPQENFELLTVDHNNGIRNDNRLENLKWASNNENIAWMMQHRRELMKEITRIVNIYGYNETLALLQRIK